MPKSLLEQLPEIVANGRKQAERILESLESRSRVRLQTREVVLPAKDVAAQDWVTQQTRQTQHAAAQAGNGQDAGWMNRLIYGDNLLAMAALLAGDEHTPSLRGKVDLIYIDPPFDSKADYRTKVTLPTPRHSVLDTESRSAKEIAGQARNDSIELEQKPTVIEQFAYSDTWADGTASYLAMITPRLILMRELLSDTGSIYVHLDWHVGHYVKLVIDEIFGRNAFKNEIVWKSGVVKGAKTTSNKYGRVCDSIFFYTKNEDYYFKTPFKPIDLNDPSNKFKHKESSPKVAVNSL